MIEIFFFPDWPKKIDSGPINAKLMLQQTVSVLSFNVMKVVKFSISGVFQNQQNYNLYLVGN